MDKHNIGISLLCCHLHRLYRLAVLIFGDGILHANDVEVVITFFL